MTKDVIALVEEEPDVAAVVAGMAAVDDDLRVRVLGGGVVQLCDEGGRPVVTFESPVFVQVRSELTRVLGPELAEVGVPVWWVEARGAERWDGSEVLALRFAGELVRRLGGVVWTGDSEYVRRAV